MALLDGIVYVCMKNVIVCSTQLHFSKSLAKSTFHSSANYRSVCVFGTVEALTDDDERLRALEAITEHVCAGRWNAARLPNRAEMKATTVVKLRITSASAKIRAEGVSDLKADLVRSIVECFDCSFDVLFDRRAKSWLRFGRALCQCNRMCMESRNVIKKIRMMLKHPNMFLKCVKKSTERSRSCTAQR